MDEDEIRGLGEGPEMPLDPNEPLTVEELMAEIKRLSNRLAVIEAGREPPRPQWAPPTPAALKEEIEKGPLAEFLAKDWADVFGPHPTKRKELAFREGRLKDDAAFDIHKRLTATEGLNKKSRAEECGWGNSWPWKLVKEAKQLKG